MAKFNSSTIRQDYGNEVLQKIRNYEDKSRKLGRQRAHQYFNLQCKHQSLTPKSIRIKCRGVQDDPNSEKIIKKAERELLNSRISQTIKHRTILEKDIQTISTDLSDTIDRELLHHIIELNKGREKKELQAASERQKKKIQILKYGKNWRTRMMTDRTRDGNTEWRNRTENTNWRSEETNNRQHTTSTQQTDSIPPATQEPHRWVRNLSKYNPTPDEISLLAKGGNFAISPKCIPFDDFVVATEEACRKIGHKGEAAALKAEVAEILKEAKAPPSNLTMKERKAIKTLKENDDIVIVPADKGKCTVIMDRDDYVQKMETKLQDTSTYKEIFEDPTPKLQKELANQLNRLEENGEIDRTTHYRIRPTQSQIPRIHGHPKIHKPPHYPLREIVDSTGGVTKNIDKHIAGIMKTYIKNTDHYIKNSKDFVDKCKNIKIAEDETLVSYDVTALYPSVPQEEAIQVFNHELMNDTNLEQKTKMKPESVEKLFKTCVEATYFIFNGRLYKQIDGLAIGASTSGFAAELFMQRFEKKALNMFTDPQTL